MVKHTQANTFFEFFEFFEQTCLISIFALQFDFGDNDSGCGERLTKSCALAVGSL